MGAVLFYHPQPQHNFLMERTTRHGLFNSLGVIVDDAIVVAMLIFGGVLEACPDLKVCIAHGGGPACYAMGRLDRGWQSRPDARRRIPKPPSSYQRQLYYDTVTGSEEALRFLLDQVGRRSRRARQRLAVRAVASLAGHVGAGAREPDGGGEGEDPLAQPRGAARPLARPA